ncbi:MAG: protein kinase, partial [Chloroflexota bacterium]
MDSNSGEQKIGRYTILSHLDSGGMGDVYKAFDPDFNRTVALKQLPALLSTNELKRKRFKRELQTIANLEHDAIIPVYDTGNDGNIHYFVMKFMAGGTLTTRIEERTLTLNDIKGIFRRIGPALDKAHSRGVFHRDLKPSNILFDEDNKAYISDFGIAKVDDANAKLSATKSVIGTPQYMSPEQCQSQIITPQSDVYSLGIILFEMISGHLPFECSNTLEWMIAHVDKMPFLLEKYRNDIPNELEEIVAKALEKDPQNRFQSVGALVAALEKVSFLSIDGDLNFGKQQKESPITKETVTNAGDEKRPFFTNIPPWLIFTGITVVLGLLILGSRPDFRAGFFPQPTPSSTQTASPTSTSTNTPQPTMTPEAPTAVPPPEGFVNVLKFDPSAIFQIDDGPLQRITSNEQLSVPSTTETLHIESNAGILELQLSDRTRLFLDQNSTIEILEIQSDESELETRIIIESGLVAVINENTAVTVQTPADIRASLYRGLIEVNEENSSTIRITIDCIEQTCTVINSDETGQTLEQGEAVQFNTNGEETTTQGARYALYNGLIAGLVITPTPTPTQTSSPTPTVPPSPTPFGSTAVDIGFSVNQQPIEAIKFGNGPVNLLFIGGIHSGLAPSTVTLAEQLIAYFEDNPQEIPKNVTLHIIPDLNPDSPNATGERDGRYNANGVDLNRNWGCDHVEDPIIGGDVVPGKGGPEAFSEPETIALRDYILEIEPASIVFWMARSQDGAISPGGCGDATAVSDNLAAIYSEATSYIYEPDYEGAVGFTIHGDAMNYLDSQGFPAIAVLLRDFVEPDFQRNLMAVRAVLQNYQYGYFDET